MSLLFDKSPLEPTTKRQKRREAEPEEEVIHHPVAIPAVVTQPLGRLDGVVSCADQNCQGTCHDILDDSRGEWRVECCFCGTGQRVPVVRGYLPPPPEGGDFVLRGGRFDGLSIAEVARTDRGADYIAWAAAEHPRSAVKKACETWLASNSRGH